MLARSLAGLLREPTDEFFENVAHLVIRDGFRSQIDLTEAFEQQGQKTRSPKPGDLLGKTKTFENAADIRRESCQVARDLVGVASEIGKNNTARIWLPAQP